ncbi:hypothetical protein HHI36_014758 [Cryptolaemus montrouzieri]|uniref:Uncharacterized protein n=1 Tax=Cryptolaemus montrouzieri TaxID=559131 RepID=A0ABD2N442_9CUCU
MEDVQGEGGGGFLEFNAYFNPALEVSDHTMCNGKTYKECDDSAEKFGNSSKEMIKMFELD